MTAADRAKRDAEIAALVPAEKQADPDKPMCRHGCATMPCRHTRTEDKHKKHIGKELRGVPLVGAGPGVIDGTRPGDRVDRLEQSMRDVAAANLARARAMRDARAALRDRAQTPRMET